MKLYGSSSSPSTVLPSLVVVATVLQTALASQFGGIQTHQLQQSNGGGDVGVGVGASSDINNNNNDEGNNESGSLGSTFNSIFDGASIVIPKKFEVTERVGIAVLDMTITNLKCYDMSIEDMTVTHKQESVTRFLVDIGLSGLDLTCELNYDYTYGVLSGDGWVQISTNDNTARSALSFTSPNFDTTPPQSSSVDSCTADVAVSRMDFEEDFASEVLEVFQGLVRGTVERAIGEVACSELASIGTGIVANMVDLAGQNLDQYRGQLGEAVTDPLYLERHIEIPGTFNPLNLQDTDGEVGRNFNRLLLALDEYLGTTVPDPSGATISGDDLAVNALLRTAFLDDDRALVVDPTSIGMDTLLFEGHDRITQFTITMNQIRVLGLDTFTRFNPFRSVGRHTIQNELTLDKLTFEFDVTIGMKPSSLDDAILQDPSSPGINERVSIAMSVEKIDVEASILLLLDEEILGSLELGPFFYSENILPCILSVVHDAQLSGLDVDPTYVDEPVLSGFVSAGLDRVISDSMHASFDMYAGVLREAIPNIFQTSIRDLVNVAFLDPFLNGQKAADCPDVQPPEGSIDFRKFFDENNIIYGDVPSLLKQMLDDELLSTNNQTVVPAINHAMVAPFTSMQSDSPGTFIFSDEMVGFSSSNVSQFGLNTVELGMKDIRVENLDSMTAPIAILEPKTTSGMVLDNFARMGIPNKKLRMGFDSLFVTTSDIDENLVLSNKLNFAVEMEASDAFLSLLAKIDAASLYNMPIKDITNVQCWLAAVAAPVLNEAGIVVEGSGFSIESLLLTPGEINFNVSCISCSSPSLAIIPEVLSSFETAGISDVVELSFVELGLELARSDFTQSYIDSVLADAELQCPNSPNYVGPNATAGVTVADVPPLSYKSLETITFAATIGFEIGLIVVAEAHQEFDPTTSWPLLAQQSFSAPAEVNLIDFTSLGTSLGSWAETGINGFLSYLTETIADMNGPNGRDLRVNNLLRSSILSADQALHIRLLDSVSTPLGFDVQFKKMSVLGLDTISEINILDAIAPQTLQNNVRWSKLGLQFVISLEIPSNNGGGRALKTSSDVIVTLELADVNMSLSGFLAMDLDELGSLELQSILHMENILPCVLSAVNNASVTEMDVSAGSISNFTVEGFQSDDIITASLESTRMVLNQYGPKIIEAIPAIFDSTARRIINHWMSYYVTSEIPSFCKSPVSEEDKDKFFVDLRDLLWSSALANQLGGTGSSQYGDLFYTAMGWVQNLLKVDQLTGLSSLNGAVVEPLTQDGSIVQSGDFFNGVTPVEVGALDATFGLRIYDARMDNLDTVGAPLELLGGLAGQPYELNNTLTFGVHEDPLRISSKIHLSLEGEESSDIQINNIVGLSLEMRNTTFFASTVTQIAESRFFGFPLRDVLNINCWLATLPAPTLNSQGVRVVNEDPTAALFELEAFIGELVLQADCMNCSSPRMEELTMLLSSPEAQDEMKDVANQFLNYVTTLMGDRYIQTTLDRLLNDASRKCPHSPIYDPDFQTVSYDAFESPDTNYSMHYLILLAGLLVALLVCATIAVFAVRFVVRRRHKRWIMKLPAHQLKRLAVQQSDEDQVESHVNTITKSLFRSPEIPLLLRYGMPLILLLNIALFLSGHLSLGATVNIEAEIAGERFHIEKFFEFSIARSIGEIWRAGGKELAFLVMIFSGVWPYAKLLMTMALWFIPPLSLSASRRGSILLWLDYLGKWSMVDIMVLVISIAAFRVSIQSPETSYLPEQFYWIEMMVIPLWGLYANMTAQILSQVTSSFIIHYHRKVVSNARVEIAGGENVHDDALNGHPSNFVPSIAHARSPDTPTFGATLRVSSNVQKGVVVEDIPPLAPSICIENGPFAKQAIASMPECTEVHKVTHQEDLGESNLTRSSFEEISISENGAPCLRSVTKTEEDAFPLCQHQFARPHRGETEKLVARRFVNKLLVACAALMSVLLVAGCLLPSFSLEIFGVVGVAVEFGQNFEEATTDHSIFSVVVLLFQQAAYLGTAKDYIGLGILSAVFLGTVLIVPIVLSVVLLRQWFTAATREKKLKRSIAIEVLQAWQYLEVYLVAVFVASWQLGPISNSMINSYCENLKDMFAQLVYYGILKEEDGQCFSVTSSIENGSFVLAAAAVVLGFIGSFVGKASAQYLRDESEIERRIQEDINKSSRFSDETSRTEDENDEPAESGFDAKIHPVPVLFTDSYRWLLQSNNQASSSAQALFTNADNVHWGLPEARAIVEEPISGDPAPEKTDIRSSSPKEQSNVAKRANTEAASPRGGRWRSDDSVSSVSVSRDSVYGKKLKFDECDEEEQSHGFELDERKPAARSPIPSVADYSTVGSQMDSVGSSFRDEVSIGSGSALESLAYSYPSDAPSSQSMRMPPPPALSKSSLYPSIDEIPSGSWAFSTTSSHHRNAPPPSSYRLSKKQNLKKLPPGLPFSETSSTSTSHHIFEDRDVDDGVSNRWSERQSRTDLKKPPPQSSSPPPSPPALSSTVTTTATRSPGLFASMLQQQQNFFQNAVANDDGVTTVDSRTTGHDDDYTSYTSTNPSLV